MNPVCSEAMSGQDCAKHFQGVFVDGKTSINISNF